MFSTNKKKVTVPTLESVDVTVPTVEGLTKDVTKDLKKSAAAAKQWGDEQAKQAEKWARPHLEHGKEVAGPALATAAEAVTTQAENAKGLIEENLPKLSEAVAGVVAAGASAKDEASKRGADAALVLRGEAVARKKRRGKGVWTFLGISALLGAAAVALGIVKKQNAAKDDPWARPLTDPYIAPVTGRDSTVAGPTPTDGTVSDVPSENEVTPTAVAAEGDVVDLTADGMPPESTTDARAADDAGTLGDAVEDKRD